MNYYQYENNNRKFPSWIEHFFCGIESHKYEAFCLDKMLMFTIISVLTEIYELRRINEAFTGHGAFHFTLGRDGHSLGD
jgi:hypothetical protein